MQAFQLANYADKVVYIHSRQHKTAACASNMQAHTVQVSANNDGVSLSSRLQEQIHCREMLTCTWPPRQARCILALSR